MACREGEKASPNATWGRGGLNFSSRPFRRGFTLLEICVVLFIIAMLFALAMPAMQSAFTEQGVRNDAHQLALMVKTAMIQSAEQHRAYVIDLSPTAMALHPAGQAAANPDAPSIDANASTDDDDSDNSSNNSKPVDVDITNQLDPLNKLLTPDPRKTNGWMAMPDGTQWVFEPGELCPATRVRLSRGDAWLEMSFGALTGNVENETYYLP
jgi:prepilin-type N-terminal cleavage/methylation domain-containing protein